MAKDPTRISEGDMVLPTLEALSEAEDNGLTTTDLIRLLRDVLKPTGQDLVISPHRNDDYFSEKVRNLRSHRKLEKLGVATFDGERYHITELGKDFIVSIKGAWESYRKQGFSSRSINGTVEPNNPCVFIEEGHEHLVNAAARKRSKELRDYAVDHYMSADGTINCAGCGFEGSTVYGDAGKGLIEIHHLKPISTSGETRAEIHVAVKDVVPLCPTCHRMVHRAPKKLLTITELRALLRPKASTCEDGE